VIGVQDLGFRFGRGMPWVFQHLTFSLPEGQTLALLGPNGRGKTTLLKCLAGLLRPTEGVTRIDGSASYVPQHFSTPFAYTVRDIVLMGRARHMGVFAAPTPADRRLADEALDSLGLIPFAERPITMLSGGEQQMVLIARALASGAQSMLLDEPTASLDFRNQAIVLATLRRLTAARGMTVVLTSHHPAHAEQLADRVLLLHGRSVFAEGPTGDVLTEANLSNLYGVPIRKAAVIVGGVEVRTLFPDLNWSTTAT